MIRVWIGLALCTGLFLFPCHLFAQEAKDAPAPSFQIGLGDEIEILVWRDDYMTREVVVQPDGFISYPLIGEVAVSGRTIPEVRAEVTERIREYLPDAQISIIIKEINSYRVYVIGKVNKPGEYRASRPVNVMQALAMAESFAKFASPDDIRVLRKLEGGSETFKFNYNDVEKGKNLDQNIDLISGDVVVVP
ncbi:polysaccharide biosynthesis/export family protein [Thermodesulfobacteriota bacterium]